MHTLKCETAGRVCRIFSEWIDFVAHTNRFCWKETVESCSQNILFRGEGNISALFYLRLRWYVAVSSSASSPLSIFLKKKRFQKDSNDRTACITALLYVPVTFFGLGFLILLRTAIEPKSLVASFSISIISLERVIIVKTDNNVSS